MRRITIMLATMLVTFALAPSALGQMTARARVSAQTVYVGETITYMITINDASSADAPTIQDIDGLRIAYAGPSTSTQTNIINGRRTETRSLTLRYSVVATRAGDFVIPAQSVQVGSETLRTGPVQFRAVEPAQSENFELHANVEDLSLYVGEPTTLTVTWYLAAQPRGFEFLGGFDGVAIESYPANPPVTRRSSAEQSNALFDGEEVTGVVGQETLNGRLYTTFTIARNIVPTRAGEITIPPITVTFDEVVESAGRGLFREERTARRVERSRPITLNVRPLPEAGRPADFNGLVGRYQIGTAAEPRDVNVGDPITLHAVISGLEPLDRVTAPGLESDPAFLEAFKPSPDGWTRAQAPPGSRAFTTTVRATTESVTEIPAVSLPYFDTELGEYRVAQSDPIPLRVRATREVTAADAVGGGSAGTPIARTALETSGGGVRAIFTTPKALASQRAPVLDRMTTTGWMAVGAAPPALYVALAGFVAIRRRMDPEEMRRHGALRRALGVLGDGDGPEAMRVYLGDRFGREAATMTAWDAEELLAPYGSEIAEEAAAVLHVREARQFGDEDGSADVAAVRDLLRRIDREVGR